MARRIGVPVLTLVLVLGIHLPAAAMDDAPSRCGQISHGTPVGQWITGTIDSPTDVDWYFFPSVPKRQLVRYVLGGLPADYRLDVYWWCGRSHSFHSYRPGVEFEELILETDHAPYIPVYVRISGVDGAFSPEPYRLQATAFENGLSILSSRTFAAGGMRHIVGEVYTNGTASAANVRATLYDSAGAVIGTVAAPTKLRGLGLYGSRRSPFVIVFTPPAGYDHYSLAVRSTSTAQPMWGLYPTQFAPFVDTGGIAHFTGEMENRHNFAIDALDVFVTLYDSMGRVLNAVTASTGREHVGAKGKSAFDGSFSHHFTGWNRWRAVGDAVAAP